MSDPLEPVIRPIVEGSTRHADFRARGAGVSAKLRLPLEPRGLSDKEAARYVGIGVTMFKELIEEGKMPKPIQIRGRKVWDRLDLDSALDDFKHGAVAADTWADVRAGQ